ncbi:MAG: NifB/NifX family molybdenum-iron cluster-binding protein [Candidatus Bathyarchaeia archaeon]
MATDGEKGLEDSVAREFGRCKTFTVVDIQGGEVKRVEVARNPGAPLGHGKGPVAAKHLADMGVGMAIREEFGPGASADARRARDKEGDR